MAVNRIFPAIPVGGFPNKGGWSGEVQTYADLPAAIERPGRVFLVRESSGFMWAHRKGLYRSDGNTWARLSNSIFEILDTEAIIRDNVDPSKCLRFELEDLSTNTTRTLRVPNQSGTIALVPPEPIVPQWGEIEGSLGDQTDLVQALAGKEALIGIPAENGQVLASTILGVRQWISLPEQVNADWNAVTGPAVIFNKPVIPPVAPVDSVNGQTGAVVLKTDDISADGEVNQFVSAADKVNLANLSGTNSGDQDLSGLLPNTHLTDFAHGDIAHTNRTDLDAVTGTNSGDQTGDGTTITGAGTPADPFKSTDFWTVSAHTENYTVLTTDSKKTLTMNNSALRTFTLPSGVVGNVGLRFTFVKLGAGQVTIQAQAGDTIADSSSGGSIYGNRAAETYATITLQLVAANKWVILGFDGTWTTT